MILKKWSFLFLLLYNVIPSIVYSQIIDNRELPPESLKIRPPFEPTERSVIKKKDVNVFIILDNADDITVKDFEDAGSSEIIMIGNVRIRFNDSFLKAEKVVVAVKNSSILDIAAYGNVEFILNNTKYLANSIHYQPSMDRGVMYSVRSVLSGFGSGNEADIPWFYRAEKVTILSSSRFVLDHVVLSKSDTRFDHFGIKVRKLWYLQNKVALAMGLEYMTGQATFLWLPAFIHLESGGNLHTSFGNEKRIGYYFVNNYHTETKIGKFDFGFDFYEQQGQYGRVQYDAKSFGILQKLKFDIELANDIRTVKNGDLFSQWVQPQFHPEGDFQRITQFGWHYKLDTTIATNGVSLNINLEDLNDPFFSQKFSYRSRFNNSKSINFSELLNPELNSWFGYQGDVQPNIDTFTRGFILNAGKFAMSGSWQLLRVSKPVSFIDPATGQPKYDPNANNQFLNSFYKYEVRSLTFPKINYNFGDMTVSKYEYSKENTVSVTDSRGIIKKISIHKLPEYEKLLSELSKTNISRTILVQDNESIITNFITNIEPVSVKEIVTNQMLWFTASLIGDAKFDFLAQRTLGTNDSSMTTDLKYLTNTNWTTVADVNRHEENGGVRFVMDFFERIVTLNNGMKINYTEQWASQAANYTNNQRVSGVKIDYIIDFKISSTNNWNEHEWNKSLLSYEISTAYSYPVYYLFRLQQDFVKESSFVWTNSIKYECLQWQRQNILGLEAEANWDFRHRVPVEDQKDIIANDPNDIYLNNKIFDQATFALKAKVFWIKVGTQIMVDILQTKTNTNAQGDMLPVWSGDNMTNRFIGGYPKLLVEFEPDKKYHYLPKLVYRYNLFEKSFVTNIGNPEAPNNITYRKDKSFNLDILWDVRLQGYQIPKLYPFIYELSEFGFVFKYYMDFVNMRNSFLKFDFVIGVKFSKYLTFRFSSQMLNNKIYLYYNGTFNGEAILNPGEVSKDFFQDLGNGLKIWDQNALKISSFKLQSLSCELIHDLQTWDMRFIFNLARRTDDIKQISFWEPYIGLAFTMKGSNSADIFPEFQKRFVPAEYQ